MDKINEDLFVAIVQTFNQKLDHANYLADIRRTLRTTIEVEIQASQVELDATFSGHEQSSLMGRIDALRWVLEELEKE